MIIDKIQRMPQLFPIIKALVDKKGLQEGFFIALENLRCKRGFVIYPGEESYPLKNNIHALSVKELELLGTY